MKLGTYLDQNKLSERDFAALLAPVGASEHTVIKWVRGERMPRPDAMLRIVEVTAGKVQPNDFYTSSPQAAE
jgi:DNA-binding transcriptional regulator YiaG